MLHYLRFNGIILMFIPSESMGCGYPKVTDNYSLFFLSHEILFIM